METVAPLVRAVIRAFYSDEFAVVIEPLLREPFYLEDDQQPKGPLSQKLGGISSKRLRQVLDQLVNHSLVQKAEVKVQAHVLDEETNEREGTKTQRNFYYIDFIHFVKIITLRLSQVGNAINSSQRVDLAKEIKYMCNQCERDYAWSDLTNFEFLCPECSGPLEELTPATSGTSFGGASSQASVDALLKKFNEQISAQSDQRDNIMAYVRQAHNAGPNLPENDPNRRLQQQENERRRLEALKERNQNALTEVSEATTVVSTGDEMGSGELAHWMQKTITGETTEDARRDALEREAKRARTEQAAALRQNEKPKDEYLLRYAQEHVQEVQVEQADSAIEEEVMVQPPVVEATEPVATFDANVEFTYTDGSKIRAGNINEDNVEDLINSCPTEDYEMFLKFLREHTAFALE